jgi:hypothetical protein
MASYENLHPPGLYLMMLRSAAEGEPEGPAGMWANEVPDGIEGEVTVR